MVMELRAANGGLQKADGPVLAEILDLFRYGCSSGDP